MQTIWKMKTPLCWAQICISTGAVVPSLLQHLSVLFHFILFSVKIFFKKIQHLFHKNGKCLYFAVEIQALLSIAWEFSAKTTQTAIQKLTLWQREVMDLHMCYRKPRTGHILDWKTNEPQNMPRNIYDSFFVLFFQFSYAENLGVQNMPKSYE